MDYIRRLQAACIDLATEEIFPNLFRDAYLGYFSSDLLSAMAALDRILSDAPEGLKKDGKVIAAKSILEQMAEFQESFNQKEFSERPEAYRKMEVNKLKVFYVSQLNIVLEGSDFDINQYVDSLRERRYDKRGLPSGLNITDE